MVHWLFGVNQHRVHKQSRCQFWENTWGENVLHLWFIYNFKGTEESQPSSFPVFSLYPELSSHLTPASSIKLWEWCWSSYPTLREKANKHISQSATGLFLQVKNATSNKKDVLFQSEFKSVSCSLLIHCCSFRMWLMDDDDPICLRDDEIKSCDEATQLCERWRNVETDSLGVITINNVHCHWRIKHKPVILMSPNPQREISQDRRAAEGWD